MRIAFITTYGVRCGIATYTEHLVKELSRKHEVVIFAEDCLENEQPNFKTELRVVRCFNRNFPDMRLLDALESYRPDVIHIQHEYGIFKNLRDLLVQITDRFEGRTVITLHTVNAANSFDLHECADYFIVHKEHGREYLVEQGIDANRVKVIPHGTLIVPYIPTNAARRKLGLPLDRKIVLSHAFFERRKNIDRIIRAVADLKDELPLYYVHVGGLHPHVTLADGKLYFEECLRLIEELGVNSDVSVVNKFTTEEELVYYLNACDVIVTLENCNFPKISASGIMHTVANKPVIASDVINFAEFPDGAFYRVKIDENSVKKAIKEILLNPELSRELSRNLLQYAERTSWNKVAQEHVRLYKMCMKEKIVEYVYT
jgi:glycosyltransferase involved in cell wall biosynthesis